MGASLDRPITVDIHRCPCNSRHPIWHLMVATRGANGDGGGVRALGGKCCGVYHDHNVVKRWRLTLGEAQQLVLDIENQMRMAQQPAAEREGGEVAGG